MFNALKRLTGRGDGNETGSPKPGHQTMSANLQRKFAKGVQYNMKIVIKGDRNVGKTCLFHRLQGKKFIESYTPTEEIQVASIHWNYKATDDIVKVEVWDVVDRGKKKKAFDGLKLENSKLEIPEEAALDAEFLDVYKGANGVILVMDITKNWTFDYIQRELPKIPEHIPIMILANHCDMSHHRTVTPHHLSFYVENLQRGPNAAQVRYGESSMRNGFGLKLLHKFFNLPFLALQRDTLLRQLETNRNETELTIHELDLYLESDDADYNKFLDNLVNKRRAMAEKASTATISTSQSSQQLQYPAPNQIQGSNSDYELKRSVSFHETYSRIGPIGGGHPIPTGLHKTAIGVGNPHSKVLGPNFTVSDVVSYSPGNSKVESLPEVNKSSSVENNIPKEQGFMSKIFGNKKDSPDGNEVKVSKLGENVASVEEFVPDDGALDRSFLEDEAQEVIPGNVEAESDSDAEFGNPLVSGFQDDLDPEDQSTNLKIESHDVSAKLNSLNLAPTINQEDDTQDGKRSSISSTENEVATHFSNNSNQANEITGDALDSWLSSDSKWRRSPEGGEDSHSDCIKTKDDVISLDSSAANSSLLDPGKKEKKKKKDKESDGKSSKKSKKKSATKEKDKTGEKRKKKTSRDHQQARERDELEEFLNGPSTTPIDTSYEAF